MARQTSRLNALRVKTLSKPGLHADGDGLYLNISSAGAKSWRVIYNRLGRRVELGIGSAGVITLAEAREKAAEARRLLVSGQDPKEVWRAPPKAKPDTTFGAVALHLIESRESGWKNAKHRQQWRNTLSTYAAPIWNKAVADVEVDDVLAILRPIWSAKPETASRVRGRIEAVLDAAKVRRLRSGENPAAWRGNLALLLPRQKKRPKQHHPSMPYSDVPAFLALLQKREGLAARALELTILTAARTSEVLNARWDEFDLKKALWTVPAARMKAGREHRVPLSFGALKLVQNLSRDCELLFPGLKPGKPLSNMAMEMCLRRMKYNHVTVHGFRSSFRDWCGEETDYARELAELALAHLVGSEVERAYRRGDALGRRREIMEAWSRFLLAGNPNGG